MSMINNKKIISLLIINSSFLNLININYCFFLNIKNINSNGGAIYSNLNDKSFNLNYLTFLNCSSSFEGGTLYITNSLYRNISKCCFESCYSSKFGQLGMMSGNNKNYTINYNYLLIIYCSPNLEQTRYHNIDERRSTVTLTNSNFTKNYLSYWGSLGYFVESKCFISFLSCSNSTGAYVLGFFDSVNDTRDIIFTNFINNNKNNFDIGVINSYTNCNFYNCLFRNNNLNVTFKKNVNGGPFYIENSFLDIISGENFFILNVSIGIFNEIKLNLF